MRNHYHLALETPDANASIQPNLGCEPTRPMVAFENFLLAFAWLLFQTLQPVAPPDTVSQPHLSSERASAAERTRWFVEEVQPHEPMLRAYLQKRFPALGEVDDVVQESYLRLMRAKVGGTLRSAKGFLFTAARNAALDLFRHRGVIRLEPLTENSASSVHTEGASPADVASLNQELEILTAAMRDLPARCRQILMLRRIYDLPHREIAARLGISEHTVEKQVGIGLRKCVEFLKLRGMAIEKRINSGK